TGLSPLSLHDALPIYVRSYDPASQTKCELYGAIAGGRTPDPFVIDELRGLFQRGLREQLRDEQVGRTECRRNRHIAKDGCRQVLSCRTSLLHLAERLDGDGFRGKRGRWLRVLEPAAVTPQQAR